VSDENDDIYGDDDDEEYKADSDNFDDDDDDDDFDEDDDEDFGRKRRRRKKKSSSRKKKVTKKPEEKDTSEEESSVLAENTRRRKRQKIDPSLLRRSERLQKYSNPSNENILHNNNKFVNKQPRNRNSQIKTETHSLVDVNNNRNSKNEDESTQRSTLVSLEEDNDESDDNENDDHNSDHDDIESNSGFDSERNYYSYLPVHFRVSILWHLTEWCLDRSEKVAREIEKWTLSDLKPTPLVRDAAGNCYWYFEKAAPCRLFLERVGRNKLQILGPEDDDNWETLSTNLTELESFLDTLRDSQSPELQLLREHFVSSVLPLLYERQRKLAIAARRMKRLDAVGISKKNILQGTTQRERRRPMTHDGMIDVDAIDWNRLNEE